MKKMIGNFNKISEEDVFAVDVIVSDGVWWRGFINRCDFEAKVNDTSCSDGINEGRVTCLEIISNNTQRITLSARTSPASVVVNG